jgi:hypothetical protein
MATLYDIVRSRVASPPLFETRSGLFLNSAPTQPYRSQGATVTVRPLEGKRYNAG